MSVDAVGTAMDQGPFAKGGRCLVLRGKVRANWAHLSRTRSDQIPGAAFGASPRVDLYDADGKRITSAQGNCFVPNEYVSSTRSPKLMSGTDRHWTRAIPLPESGFDSIRVDGVLLDLSSDDIGGIEPFDVSFYEDKPGIEEAGAKVVWESVKFGEATQIAPYSLRNIAEGTAQPDWTVSVDGTSVMETVSLARPGWVCLAVYGSATLDAVDVESGEAPFPGISIFQDGRLYAYTSDCKGGTEFEDQGYVHRSSIEGISPGESVKWYYHTSAPSSQLDFVTVRDTLFSVEGGEMTLGEAKPAVEPVGRQVLKSLGEEFAIRHREGVLDETWIFSVDDVFDSGGCQVAVGTVELNSISPGYHSAWLPVMSMGTLEGSSYRQTREQDVFSLSCDDEQLIQDGYTQLWYVETVPGQKVKWYQFFADTLWKEDIRAIEVGHPNGPSAVIQISND